MSRAEIHPIHLIRMAYGWMCYRIVMVVPLGLDPLRMHLLGSAGYYAYQPEPWWQPLLEQMRASRGRSNG